MTQFLTKLTIFSQKDWGNLVEVQNPEMVAKATALEFRIPG
jgi:hypothetical protein